MEVEQARAVAKIKATQVVLGEDPAQEVANTKKALSVTQALEIFSEQHMLKIKPKAAQNYTSLVERFIIPALKPLHNYKCVDYFVARLLAINLVLQQKSIASEAIHVFQHFFGLCRGLDIVLCLKFENLFEMYNNVCRGKGTKINHLTAKQSYAYS